MRRGILFAALVLILCGMGTAQAQNRGLNPFFFGGVDPTQIVNLPIDTSNSAVPIAQPQTRSTGFRFLDLFPKFSFPLGQPRIGQSVFPSQNQMPGFDYLKAFRIRRPGFGQ